MSRRVWSVLVFVLTLTSAVAAEEALLAPLSDGVELSLPELDPDVPSPSEVLGYPIGERFTRYHRVLDYLERLDEASDRVDMWQYGETYEGRPLVLVAIGDAGTITDLEALAAVRARLAAPGRLSEEARSDLLETAHAVAWLAYGIHGDESSSTEAAMAVAYVLAAGRGERAPALEGSLVLIDPLANPDGRERYLDSYLGRRGKRPDPDPDAFEHVQGWPGGRGNHYLVDLNRDWTWVTQRETADRLAEYRRWEPQVYADFHEMGEESTYFFPPPAEPVHPAFASRAERWLEIFGAGNAAVFDELGWTYYVGEEFDLFYPGYGDTYPILRGAVGMTYEMAGGGEAGALVELPEGRTLSLADRVARHLATSLATVATTVRHREALVADFVAARTPSGPERIYAWAPDQPEAGSLAELLATHGMAVERLGEGWEVEATSVASGERRETALPAGSYTVSTAQSLGALADVLLAAQAEMPPRFLERQRRRVEANQPAEFYDITAWSLPLAYNVETWVVDEGLRGIRRGSAASAAERADPPGLSDVAELDPAGVGYLLPPQGLAGYRIAAALQRERVPHRVALAELTLGGRRFGAGTIFVPRRTAPTDLAELIEEATGEGGLEIQVAETSRTEAGIPLGSEQMAPIRPVRIGLLAGSGVESTSFGFLWHLFDRLVGVDHSVLDVETWSSIDLSSYDVVVFPGGDYERRLGEDAVADLEHWLDAGGTLVAVGGALDWLRKGELVSFEKRGDDGEERGEGDDADGDEESDALGDEPEEVEPRAWEHQLFIPGAAVASELAPRHPLAIGLPSPPAVLVWGAEALEPSGDPRRDVLTARDEAPIVAGFAWPEGREHVAGSLLVGLEPHGEGRIVVFAEHPAFRLFWRGTMPLLLDAVLWAPSLR